MNAVVDTGEVTKGDAGTEAKADFLATILRQRRERVAEQRRTLDAEALSAAALASRANQEPHRLRKALRRTTGFNVIAEFKRASPSKGAIHPDADPARVAAEYAAGGACAISVLTEEDHFRGSLDDLRRVRERVTLPVLRKDFVVDELQIYEAAEAGASAVLLIVRALADNELRRFRALVEDELGMDALVEVHTVDEMRRALLCGATLVGVNNRDLDTFRVALDTSERLAAFAPPGVVLVSESGLRDREDLRRLRLCGYRGFLIGETLMRTGAPASLLAELVRGEAIEVEDDV